MWFKCLNRWVKALRDPKFESAINTTNGVESLNKVMKFKFFSNASDKSISTIVKIIVEQYCRKAYDKYSKKNVTSSSLFKTTNSAIPKYLVGLSDNFIRLCRPSFEAARTAINHDMVMILENNPPMFKIKSIEGSGIYTIDTSIPTCDCLSFRMHYRPCKHLFILLELDHIKWEDFPESYRNMPIAQIDQDAVENYLKSSNNSKINTSNTSDNSTFNDDKENHNTTATISHNKDKLSLDHLITESNSLKRRRGQINTLMDNIKQHMHICTDRDILARTVEELQKIDQSIKNSLPTEVRTVQKPWFCPGRFRGRGIFIFKNSSNSAIRKRLKISFI